MSVASSNPLVGRGVFMRSRQGSLPEARPTSTARRSSSWPIRCATRVRCERAEAAGSMGHQTSTSDAALPALITQCSLGREDSSASLSKSEEEGLKFGMEGWHTLAAGSIQSEKRFLEAGADGNGELIEFSNVLQRMSNSLKKVAETNTKLRLEAASWKAKYERLLQEQDGHKSRFAGGKEQQQSAPQQCRESGHHTIFYIPEQKSRSEISSQKVPFKLSWGFDGDSSRRHKHDIVSYESGNISSVTSSNRQITLMWESSPRTVCIFTRPNSEPVHKLCQQMIRWLKEEKQISVFVEPRVRNELLDESTEFDFVQTWEHEEEVLYLHEKVDLVITLGGDGTVLWTASLFKGPVPPTVSFSMGSLGFLAGFQSEKFEECLDYALRGPLYITLRHRLQCEVVRKDRSPDEPPEVYLVLNEVAIDRAMSSSLTNLDCYCDNEFLTSVQGDGLILSTPSGSTAYSLAAGGSMVHPHVPGILFTPICPHSLSFRPLILPGNVTVKVQVPADSNSHVWASFDGKDRLQLSAGDALLCHIGCWPVPTASRDESTHHFLCSVRERLHWNLRKKQGT